MFAINHAATALIFKRRFGDVSFVALLSRWSAAKAPTDGVSGRDENMSHAERVSGLAL
jgi:hypothetical protein